MFSDFPRGLVDATSADLLGTARGKAFHVVTDVPVVAYDIFPWGGKRARLNGVKGVYGWDAMAMVMRSDMMMTATL